MEYQNILFDISDGVATLTLNRPDKLNSFTQAMHDEVRHALKRGAFHRQLGAASVAVDLCAIVQVLVEVAQAVQHQLGVARAELRVLRHELCAQKARQRCLPNKLAAQAKLPGPQ